MYHKQPAPLNHRYLRHLTVDSTDGWVVLQGDDARVEFSLWSHELARVRFSGRDAATTDHSRVILTPGQQGGTGVDGAEHLELAFEDFRLTINRQDGTFVYTAGGREVLRSAPAPFGHSGPRKIALFEHEDGAVVYGLGEKTGPLDKAGRSWHFWNVDVVADHPHHCDSDHYDPAYASIPLHISKRAGAWFGVLLNNPYRTYVHAGLKAAPGQLFHPALGLRDPSDIHFALGAWNGDLDLWLIPGPTLGDVVRRFARLTGTHEMPPLWALGYHQCRWSYMSAKEIGEMSDRLAEYRIPTGAIWMDIDYMDNFAVYTWDPKTFSNEDRKAVFDRVRSRGTRLVTIVDPGVRAEPGYSVYDEGMKRDVFCRAESGEPYVGFVWPGVTVFPDYSLTDGKRFWAEKTADWLGYGLDGIWNDMNDPSSGPCDLTDMRFGKGTIPHEAFHNQYGNLMAEATLDGFELFDPNKRPFILTRSASTGAQRSCAVWTGDNASSEAHLAMSIPMSINLALSGVSFNGPDVGGFMKDVSEELLVTWMLAGALFPFFRNHSCAGTRRQEPWMFQPESVATMRAAINTRAKLMPYLYSEFFRHHLHGDALMRPMAYEFPGAEFERIGDQYLIGPNLLVAPFVDTTSPRRAVRLPEGAWFDLRTGQWVEGGRDIEVPRDRKMILYVRDGAIIPTVAGADHYPQPDMTTLELHVFLRDTNQATVDLYEDDGETRAYTRGEYNFAHIRVARSADVPIEVDWSKRHFHRGAKQADVYFHGWAPKDSVAAECQWPFIKLTAPKVILPLV